VNHQTPITKLQLITNTQYSITKKDWPVLCSPFGYLVIDYWILIGDWDLVIGDLAFFVSHEPPSVT